jgi:SM-20-related protein
MFRTNDLAQLMQKIEVFGWGIIEIDSSVCENLARRILELEENGFLKQAHVTAADNSAAIRNDFTYWLESSHHEAEKNFIQGLRSLQDELKNYFRISLTHNECHFALYPQGHYYQKHIDQTIVHNKRFFSFVLYLNQDWKASDGGLLIGYDSQGLKSFEVLPEMGKMIVFRSDIPHEVQKSLRSRRSIAGWFRT